MEDEFSALRKRIKEGFSFLAGEVRSWGNSTAISTSSTGEPSAGM